MALEEALEGKAREWRDYVIFTNLGLHFCRCVQAERPTDRDYMTYYRYLRGELFARCGLQYGNPGEHTKKQWAEYSIPEMLSSQEDMDKVIREVTQFYHLLHKHGLIDAGNPAHEQALLASELSPLRNKTLNLIL